MYQEIDVPLEAVRASVAEMARTAEPLGAYASLQRVRYLFLRPDGVHCATTNTGGAALPSITSDLPLYDWHEREMRQKQGITFDGHADSRPLFIGEGTIPEALTAQGKGVNVVVVGPVHAGIIEPGRFTFSTGGETTIHLDAQFSYGHRDIERALEGWDAFRTAPLIARICGGCSVARSWSYARALEHLAGFQSDEATEYARTVLAELERLYNHIFDLANVASGAGYGRGLAIGLGLKERVLRLCAQAASHRLLFDAIVPGGVKSGVLEQPEGLRDDLRSLRPEVARFMDELFENRSVVRRLQGAGMLDSQTARLFGACGPARRASGGTLDVRAFSPYGAYGDLGVRAVTSNGGDVLARCRVKRGEIKESFRLLDESLAVLVGRVVSVPHRLSAKEGCVTTAVEGSRGTETVSLEVNAAGALERLHVISASYRNWPSVVRAMEGNIIPDFPLVNKSFNLCYSCMDR
ncbi:MAG: hydrogenase large subunit [Vulcanimicrobiaceae bacterium]